MVKLVRNSGFGTPGSTMVRKIRRARSPPACELFPVITQSRSLAASIRWDVPSRRMENSAWVSSPAMNEDRMMPDTLSNMTTPPVVWSKMPPIVFPHSSSPWGASDCSTPPCREMSARPRNDLPDPGW